jgi:hypothetical protein
MEDQRHGFYSIKNSWGGPADQIRIDGIDLFIFYRRYVREILPELFYRQEFPVISHGSEENDIR